MTNLRDMLENNQVPIYLVAVMTAALIGYATPRMTVLEPFINPALAFMLFVTFLQSPVTELGRAFQKVRFLGVLLFVNFVAVPALVFALMQFMPVDPLIRLGVLLVLLTPCIDYVVTFAHLGGGDAKLLLASTPILLIIQILLLPVYLGVFLGNEAKGLVEIGPFVDAFLWLIVLPLAAATMIQVCANTRPAMESLCSSLAALPVPATAVVLFIVVAAVVPQLGLALDGALKALPVYIAFAAIAPTMGWLVARGTRLELSAARAVAFSAGTRNSLVVLPLGLAIPGAMPLLPAVIVTQTLVELVSETIYVRVIARLGNRPVVSDV